MRAAFVNVLTCACLCAAGAVSAAEWSMAPRVGWSVDHDSNRSLVDEADAGQAATLQLDLALKRATGRSLFSLQPHLDLQRYTGNDSRDADNESLAAVGNWNFPRSMFTARAALAHQNTLGSEFADSGIIDIDTRRRSKTGALSWTHAQTKDRNQLSVQVSHADIDYQGSEAYRTSGYRYPSLSVTQVLGFSPRSSMQLTAYGSSLRSDADSEVSNSVGAQVGFSHDLTSNMSLSLAGGLSRKTTGSGGESGYTGELELTRSDARTKWRLFAQRSVAPSGFGVLVTRTEAGLAFDRRLAPRWATTMSIRSIGNDDFDFTRSGEVRRYERLDAGLIWQASRTWLVSGLSSVSRMQRFRDEGFAEGWRLMCSAAWSPNPRIVSR